MNKKGEPGTVERDNYNSKNRKEKYNDLYVDLGIEKKEVVEVKKELTDQEKEKIKFIQDRNERESRERIEEIAERYQSIIDSNDRMIEKTKNISDKFKSDINKESEKYRRLKNDLYKVRK